MPYSILDPREIALDTILQSGGGDRQALAPWLSCKPSNAVSNLIHFWANTQHDSKNMQVSTKI